MNFDILVAAGCSHTHGSAFVESPCPHPGPYRWKTKQLEDKYKVECTPEFITNNLTWMAKLKNHFTISKIYNFGYGGMGTTSAIRAMYNYCFRTEDISNTVFMLQLQSTFRNSVYFNGYKGSELVSLGEFLRHPGVEKEFQIKYSNYFVNEPRDIYLYLTDILKLQEYIESRNGIFKIIPFWFSIPNWPISTINRLNLTNHYLDSISFNCEEQKDIGLVELLNRLNIINLKNQSQKYGMVRTNNYTLHSEGLVENDHHFSEYGNELLANMIADNINTKLSFTITNNMLCLAPTKSI